MRQEMMGFGDAMASARPQAYANNLHLAADRLPHQYPITQFLQAGCSSRSSWLPTNSVKALKAIPTPCNTLWKAWPHCLQTHSIYAAYCYSYRRSSVVVQCVFVYVCHDHVPCKNGWTDLHREPEKRNPSFPLCTTENWFFFLAR